MSRGDLIKSLIDYKTSYPEEKKFIHDFLTLLNDEADCFKRALKTGHITGSSWIVNKSRDKALLTYHRKLNRWLQLGGHADGEEDILNVSKREAREESGLSSLVVVSRDIFDIDIHLIPANVKEDSHHHYDIRYLFEADDSETLIVSQESKKLKWIPFAALSTYTSQNKSILRMAEKTPPVS